MAYFTLPLNMLVSQQVLIGKDYSHFSGLHPALSKAYQFYTKLVTALLAYLCFTDVVLFYFPSIFCTHVSCSGSGVYPSLHQVRGGVQLILFCLTFKCEVLIVVWYSLQFTFQTPIYHSVSFALLTVLPDRTVNTKGLWSIYRLILVVYILERLHG